MFQKKTVDSVIGTFTKAINDLAIIEDEQASLAVASRQIANDALVVADAADSEASRAASVASKIAALVS